MDKIEGHSLSQALQILAHNRCSILHPDDQINMTGWFGSADNIFIVSCALCKMHVSNIYKEKILSE